MESLRSIVFCNFSYMFISKSQKTKMMFSDFRVMVSIQIKMDEFEKFSMKFENGSRPFLVFSQCQFQKYCIIVKSTEMKTTTNVQVPIQNQV